ncbi:MAG: peptidylprolyl isomerase [Candidatus Limnocylindrales bacterium]
MTVRTRYAPKPTRRRTRRDDTRRAVLVTVSFVAAIAVAFSLFAGVFVASYYSDHAAAVGSVNGEAISKDAVRDRVALNLSRDKRIVQNYNVLRNQGKVTQDEYTAMSSGPNNDMTSTTQYSDSLQQLTRDATLRQYASKHGITVSDQQVKDQIKTDSTIPEMRHVMVIGVDPKPTPPADAPTAEEVQIALVKAQGYITEIKAGTKKWADVAKEAAGSSATQDIGVITKDNLGQTLEPGLVDAIFNLANVNDITAPFKGLDGLYRIATITSIVAPYVDSGWERAISGDYQGYARAEALQKAVKDSIDKQYIDTPTVQRHVQEIYISPGYGQPGNGDEVKISMMVFAPSHDATNAGNVATTDPAWAEAKTRADAAVATLRADPSKFATMAADTTVNDETIFRNNGCSLPWIPADIFNAHTANGQTGLGLTSVSAAVFALTNKPNTILDPVQEPSQGYVVVKFEGRRAAPDQRIADVQLELATGADFTTMVKQESAAGNATDGGDLGWVSRYMLGTDQENAIFSTPIGGVSQVVSDTNGYTIYKVIEEQTRLPDAATTARLRTVVFQRWLSDLQANTNVWTDQAGLTAISPASPTP